MTNATYADLMAVPGHLVAELVNGELHVSPRPAVRHARAASYLGGVLFQFGGDGGWVILDEPELHFGDDVLVPDLAGWRRERFPALADDQDLAYITVPPDWVCEVASPSTERFDRSQKMAVYLRAGVQYLWLVLPLQRLIEAYQVDVPTLLGARFDVRWLLLDVYSDGAVRIPPFDSLEFSIDALWRL